MANSNERYRKDIDGLRAVAVLSVLAYHAGIPGFSGGYVGVDVFFVISGFLITGIIVRDLELGRFTIGSFYERRVRRILPALFGVTFVTTVIAFGVLLPSDLFEYGKTLTALGAFSSNIAFWKESGYFAGASEEKLLLHTWSLSIEEQFYLLYPLLLVCLFKWFRRYLYVSVVVISVLSFALSAVLTAKSPVFSFFMLPTRAWELLCGASIAITPTYRMTRTVRFVISTIGSSLIVFAVVFFDRKTVFPGLYAAIPCAGACCLIASCVSRCDAPINKILSTSPFVFFGKISYSLYLWHWPILVVARYVLTRKLQLWESIALLVVSCVVSYFSWKYVELPLRQTRRLGRRNILLIGVAGSALFAFSGAVLVTFKGFPGRVSDDVIKIAEFHKSLDRPNERCMESPRSLKLRSESPCTIGAPSVKSTFLLWGDSHAAALTTALSDYAKTRGVSGVIATKTSCPPITSDRIGVATDKGGDCIEHNKKVLRMLQNDPSIVNVVLMSRWSVYVVGFRDGEIDGVVGRDPLLFATGGSGENLEQRVRLFEEGLRATVSTIRKMERKAYLVDPIPEGDADAPSIVARRKLFKSSRPSVISLQEYRLRNAQVMSVINDVVNKYGVGHIAPSSILCNRYTCAIGDNSNVFYADDDHLSRFGATRIMSAFRPIFAVTE